MIRTTLVVAISLGLVALMSCASAVAKIEGRWAGDIVIPGETTRLIIDFQQTTGGLEGRMSLPNNRLLGKPLGEIRQNGSALDFIIPARRGNLEFKGVVSGDSIAGDARDQQLSVPVRLRRIGATPALPYHEEQVRFQSRGATLSGSLLIPQVSGPMPAVVLAHGSSTPDRNDFRYYADLYARAGIAAFIYDKRGTGPEADGGRVSLETLAQDLRAAAAMLRARHDIDARQIGLWGFSQGGWLLPMLASNEDYAFVVVLSGPGVSYAEVNRFADRTRLQREGFAAADVEAADRALARVDQYARDRVGAPALQVMLDEAQAHRWAHRITLPRTVPTDAELSGRLRWLDLDLDPAVFWRRVDEPVLLIYGEADDTVPDRRSAERITAALHGRGNEDVVVIRYPGANHELAPAPSLENDIIAWSTAHVR